MDTAPTQQQLDYTSSLICLHTALNISPIMDCYWVGGSTPGIWFTVTGLKASIQPSSDPGYLGFRVRDLCLASQKDMPYVHAPQYQIHSPQTLSPRPCAY